jgi:hypothetical protein
MEKEMSFLLGLAAGVGLMLVPKVFAWVSAKIAAGESKL